MFGGVVFVSGHLEMNLCWRWIVMAVADISKPNERFQQLPQQETLGVVWR